MFAPPFQGSFHDKMTSSVSGIAVGRSGREGVPGRTIVCISFNSVARKFTVARRAASKA